jgi:RimJ/RimL family protein N-acetyltransferase
MGRIVGERIVLREYRWEDLADIRAWVTDAETTRYLSGTFYKPHTLQQTEEYLRNVLEGGAGANFIIAERESLSYLGQCNIMRVDNIARKAELGFVIGREHTGKGYGYEAGRMLIDFAFRQMNLNRVSLKVHADNPRAIRLYEKLGLRHEGCLREEVYQDGQYVDVLVMGLLRREWQPIAG